MARNGWARPRSWWCILLAALALPGRPGHAQGLESSADSPARAKAAYLLNFPRYVTWPEEVEGTPPEPWVIGVLWDDAVAEALVQAAEGRSVGGRPFAVRTALRAAELRDCHMVFLGPVEEAELTASLAELRGLPILTAGDAPQLFRDGGIIRFRLVDGSVLMDINLEQSRAAGFMISVKMLEVAYEVWDHELIRRQERR